MSRIQIEISLGILLVLLTGVMLIVYGLNEPNRMALLLEQQEAQAIEVGAELFDNNCKGCHGPQGEGIPNLCPPLNDRSFFEGRLTEVGWAGTQEDYIIATVSSGRLASTRPELYPGSGSPVMPAWSEHYGGPLREDQIRDIAAFIMNWESTAPDRAVAVAPEGPVVGTDITQELPEGNPENGEALANAQGCVGCHVSTQVGPPWMPTADQAGIGARAAERIEQPDYTGSAATAEQYLFESIVLPNVHIVEGYEPLMPADYGEKLNPQDVADLITYMLTLR